MKMKEVMVFDNGGGDGSGADEGNGSSGHGAANSCGGCHEAQGSALCPFLTVRAPPPFLRKVYHMVEDSEIDHIISWSGTNDSFVIWDYNKLSTEVFSKYFSHNNFTSFLCQLNVYGFKKKSWEGYEFQNKWFQKWKPELLVNIKRKNQLSQTMPLCGERRLSTEQMKLGTETELHKLRNDLSLLKHEVLNLKRKQEGTEKELVILRECLQKNEAERQQKAVSMAKESDFSPTFVHQLKQIGESSSIHITKKKRGTKSPTGPGDAVDTETSAKSADGNSQVEEELMTVQSEMLQAMSSADGSSSPMEEPKANAVSLTKVLDMNSNKYALFEKLLMDDMGGENAATGEQPLSIVALMKELVEERSSSQ